MFIDTKVAKVSVARFVAKVIVPNCRPVLGHPVHVLFKRSSPIPFLSIPNCLPSIAHGPADK